MKVEFKSSFAKDLRKVKVETLKAQVHDVIEQTEQAKNIQEINHLRKLRGAENYYRIKLGDFRIGIIIENDVIIFVRFLHRKDIYRYFP